MVIAAVSSSAAQGRHTPDWGAGPTLGAELRGKPPGNRSSMARWTSEEAPSRNPLTTHHMRMAEVNSGGGVSPLPRFAENKVVTNGDSPAGNDKRAAMIRASTMEFDQIREPVFKYRQSLALDHKFTPKKQKATPALPSFAESPRDINYTNGTDAPHLGHAPTKRFYHDEEGTIILDKGAAANKASAPSPVPDPPAAFPPTPEKPAKRNSFDHTRRWSLNASPLGFFQSSDDGNRRGSVNQKALRTSMAIVVDHGEQKDQIDYLAEDDCFDVLEATMPVREDLQELDSMGPLLPFTATPAHKFAPFMRSESERTLESESLLDPQKKRREARRMSAARLSIRNSVRMSQMIKDASETVEGNTAGPSEGGGESSPRKRASLFRPQIYESKWLIDPKSSFTRWWDVVLIALLLFISICTPYEVAFLIVKFDILFMCNRVIDFISAVDIVINFRVLYSTDEKSGKRITDRRAIITQYATTWFPIDMLGVMGGVLDTVGILLDSRSVSKMKIIRAVRLLRLTKLVRVLRAGIIIQRLEDSFPIDYGIMMMLQFIVNTALISHWVACAWRMIPMLQPDEVSWLDNFKALEARSEAGDIYVGALYWSVLTLASTGYGDILPITASERIFAIFVMLLGAYFFGYVVGSITSIVATRNVRKTEFYHSMDELNAFMEEHMLPLDLKRRLREFFRYRHNNSSTSNVHTSLMARMSPSLRAEVAFHTSACLISDVGVFANCSQDFITAISMQMVSETYASRETIIHLYELPHKMYITRRGVVASEGKVYNRGGVFGVDMLWDLMLDIAHSRRRNYKAVALTFCDTMAIHQLHLSDILTNLEADRHALKRAVTQEIFRSEVLAYTRAVQRVHTGRRSTHARILGDPNGRENFYYNKLLYITSGDPIVEKQLIQSSKLIQAQFRKFRKIRSEHQAIEQKESDQMKSRLLSELKAAVSRKMEEVMGEQACVKVLDEAVRELMERNRENSNEKNSSDDISRLIDDTITTDAMNTIMMAKDLLEGKTGPDATERGMLHLDQRMDRLEGMLQVVVAKLSNKPGSSYAENDQLLRITPTPTNDRSGSPQWVPMPPTGTGPHQPSSRALSSIHASVMANSMTPTRRSRSPTPTGPSQDDARGADELNTGSSNASADHVFSSTISVASAKTDTPASSPSSILTTPVPPATQTTNTSQASQAPLVSLSFGAKTSSSPRISARIIAQSSSGSDPSTSNTADLTRISVDARSAPIVPSEPRLRAYELPPGPSPHTPIPNLPGAPNEDLAWAGGTMAHLHTEVLSAEKPQSSSGDGQKGKGDQ